MSETCLSSQAPDGPPQLAPDPPGWGKIQWDGSKGLEDSGPQGCTLPQAGRTHSGYLGYILGAPSLAVPWGVFKKILKKLNCVGPPRPRKAPIPDPSNIRPDNRLGGQNQWPTG